MSISELSLSILLSPFYNIISGITHQVNPNIVLSLITCNNQVINKIDLSIYSFGREIRQVFVTIVALIMTPWKPKDEKKLMRTIKWITGKNLQHSSRNTAKNGR